MKRQLLGIINTTGKKQISARIKGNKELFNWLLNETPDDCVSISERVYIILHGDSRYCQFGKRRRFDRGKYLLCGHQSICQCNKIITAKKVIDTKAKFTTTKNKEINKRRKQTIQDKYGVSFISQSQQYKEAIRKNNKEKYGKWHTQSHIPNWAIEILNDRDKFAEYIQVKSRKEILKEFNIYYGTFNSYCKKYDLYESSRSYFEKDISNLLTLFDINFVQNNRTIISPKEVDFFLPDYNLAIECNGLYWHTEDKVDKKYHYDKMMACKEKGIQLLSIYEDEWLEKQELVKNRISYKLNLINDKVFARKCSIKEIEKSKETTLFLRNNHIQGPCSSQIKIGLYDMSENLVSLMTFSKNRRFMNSQNYEYELVRFCSSTNVVGGASRLFKYFVRKYNPKSIVSYSSNNWNKGKLYQKLGFIYDSENIGYSYTDNVSRFHRFNFTKYKLVEQGYDPKKTECEIMIERGYRRIWDCGNKKWIWNNN